MKCVCHCGITGLPAVAVVNEVCVCVCHCGITGLPAVAVVNEVCVCVSLWYYRSTCCC